MAKRKLTVEMIIEQLELDIESNADKIERHVKEMKAYLEGLEEAVKAKAFGDGQCVSRYTRGFAAQDNTELVAMLVKQQELEKHLHYLKETQETEGKE